MKKKTGKRIRALGGLKVTPRPRATASTAGRDSTPRTVATYDELCDLKRDHVDAGDFWMITDGWQVTLANQASGHPTKASITLPRNVFDAFVDWYMTGVWKRPRRLRMKG
jgi:hypothetical protein